MEDTKTAYGEQGIVDRLEAYRRFMRDTPQEYWAQTEEAAAHRAEHERLVRASTEKFEASSPPPNPGRKAEIERVLGTPEYQQNRDMQAEYLELTRAEMSSDAGGDTGGDE